MGECAGRQKRTCLAFTGNGVDIEETATENKHQIVSDLKQGKTYIWKVKTCAKEGGQLCGDWSEEKSITITKIGAPTDPYPTDGATVYTHSIPTKSHLEKC